MIVELTKEQFDALLKEALDEMDDATYVELVKRIAADAKLRGLRVGLTVQTKLRIKRTRNG